MNSESGIGQFLPFWPIRQQRLLVRWPIQAQIIPSLNLQFRSIRVRLWWPIQVKPLHRFRPIQRVSRRPIYQLLLRQILPPRWPICRLRLQPNHLSSRRRILRPQCLLRTRLLILLFPLLLLNHLFLLRLLRLPAEAVSKTPSRQISHPRCNQKHQLVFLAHQVL